MDTLFFVVYICLKYKMIFLFNYIKILLKLYMNKRKATDPYIKSKKLLEEIHKIIMTHNFN